MSAELSICIRDGTFPDSNDLLNAAATPDGISDLLVSIAKSKEELRDEIQQVSQGESGNVDEWISQARKIQDDIARCKVEARQIVEEHERVEALRAAARDANSKAHLLDTEIAFTAALEHELQSIAEITQTISEVQTELASNTVFQAVGKITSLKRAIHYIGAGQTRSLLLKLDDELRRQCQVRLTQMLNMSWHIEQKNDQIVVKSGLDQLPQGMVNAQGEPIPVPNILEAMQELEILSLAEGIVLQKVEASLQPLMVPQNSKQSSSFRPAASNNNLGLSKEPTLQQTMHTLETMRMTLPVLHQQIPGLVRDKVAHELYPKLVSGVISDWLDPALPQDVADLQHTKPLTNAVRDIIALLQQYSWPGDIALTEWIDQLPRRWLTKRRMASLDGVRKAFSQARGQLRPEERVERQTVTAESNLEPNEADGAEEDDWNANWDEESNHQPNALTNDSNDDEASGWDFETESDHSDSKVDDKKSGGGDEDDAGEAWGWGDDDATKEGINEMAVPNSKPPTNRGALARSEPQEMVLAETYYITDIPDFILEITGKDMASAQMLRSTDSHHFADDSAANGLATLPNLTLALFRATASTYYSLPSATYSLSNMNLYNDTLYIVQRLSSTPDPTSIEPSLKALQKFARQVYTSELDTQRTILTDLLDGAQGFERCTTFPQSQSCHAAITSVTDRLRHLHSTWSSILGPSHLHQSLGTLLTMTFSKMIKDIEDMDDISEAESKQLVTYCQDLLNLQDLFVSSSSAHNLPPIENNSSDPGSAPLLNSIVLYVPNYLRFQYLQQILESSLVDIKYLWTEGELSLEFSADEVTDLIKALFAESQHRRNAIREIRGSAV